MELWKGLFVGRSGVIPVMTTFINLEFDTTSNVTLLQNYSIFYYKKHESIFWFPKKTKMTLHKMILKDKFTI